MNVIYFIAYNLPSPEEFQRKIETQIWDDMLAYVGISMTISLVYFLLSKIAG